MLHPAGVGTYMYIVQDARDDGADRGRLARSWRTLNHADLGEGVRLQRSVGDRVDDVLLHLVQLDVRLMRKPSKCQ